MSFTIKRTTLWWTAAAVVIGLSAVAHAGGPVALTDRQLDRVTAAQGGPAAVVNAGASATGLVVFGGSSTIATITEGNSPFDGSNATAIGTADGLALNGPAGSGQSTATVSTLTEAPGNVVVTIGWNVTLQVGGLTTAIGVSSTTGVLIPGM